MRKMQDMTMTGYVAWNSSRYFWILLAILLAMSLAISVGMTNLFLDEQTAGRLTYPISAIMLLVAGFTWGYVAMNTAPLSVSKWSPLIILICALPVILIFLNH